LFVFRRHVNRDAEAPASIFLVALPVVETKATGFHSR